MDLIFKRYHNPYEFLDSLIQNDELLEGIQVIFEQVREERDKEYYLSMNPWNEETYEDWKKKIYSPSKSERNMSKKEAEVIYKAEYEKSQNILKGFKPPKK